MGPKPILVCKPGVARNVRKLFTIHLRGWWSRFMAHPMHEPMIVTAALLVAFSLLFWLASGKRTVCVEYREAWAYGVRDHTMERAYDNWKYCKDGGTEAREVAEFFKEWMDEHKP